MPPAAPADRFRKALAALVGSGKLRLGVAVSGGPDSLALLLLASQALKGSIAAATVDHGLRPEGAAEARHVASICADLGVPHAVLRPAAPIAGNLQAGARRARYKLLEQWRVGQSLDWVATAHHADDQLETMVMRLLRGSGIDGLAAIRAVNGHVLRPLLGFRKAELVAIAKAGGFAPVDDPSNRDDRFDRVRLRGPLAAIEFDPDRLVRSAAAFAQASEALDWVAAREAQCVVSEQDGIVRLSETGYPPELLRRIVQTCLARFDPAIDPRGPAIDRLLAALAESEKATIGTLLVEPDEAGWRFSLAPPRRRRGPVND